MRFWQFILMSPAWLWAIPIAAAVPVLVHLLSRGVGRMVSFPSIEFITKASAESKRYSRPRSLLLLLLRTLALLLIAMAFVQPIWEPEQYTPPAREARNVAILIDSSASMQRVSGNSMLFDQARDRARELLGQMNPKTDRAAVLYVKGSGVSALPEMSGNFSTLLRELDYASVSDLPADASSSIRQADVLAASSHHPGPLEIVCLSDLQKSSWQNISLANVRTRSVKVAHEIFGKDSSLTNCAISDIQIKPAAPIVGEPITVTAKLTQTNGKARQIDVAFTSNSMPIDTRSIKLPRVGGSNVQFTFTPITSEPTLLSISISPTDDALAIDNQIGMFVQPRLGRKLLLITDQNTADQTAAAYYVARALNPTATAKTGIQLTTATSSDAIRQVAGQDAIVIVGASLLDKPLLDQLYRHTTSGGTVIWFVDSEAAVRSLSLFSELTPLGITPASVASWRQHEKPVELSFDMFSPLLEIFTGNARESLHSTTVTQHVIGQLADNAKPLITLQDGSPIAATKSLGRGNAAVLGFRIDPHASDLVKRRAFVAFIHELIRKLSGESKPQPRTLVGSSASITLAGNVDPNAVKLVGPNDESIEVLTSQASESQTILYLGIVEKAGPIRVLNSETDQLLGGIWVEADPRESDLTVTAPRKLQRAYRSTATDVTAEAGLLDQRIELWPWLLLGGLCFLAIEMLVMSRVDSGGKSQPVAGGAI